MYIITKILKFKRKFILFKRILILIPFVINKEDGKNMMLYDRKYKTL